jgi:hypothetical protein
MTPTATTPAGRKAQNGRSGTGGAPPDHRRKLRQPPGARAPRRVSGPLGGNAATAPRPHAPRPRTRPATSSTRQAPLATRVRAFVRSLPDHAVIDRLVRGRVWILALGVMLAGIVAMQVEVLKLGASIGRSVQRSSVLSVRNEQLQASVASLTDDQRIERLAAGMGMVMTPPNAVGFLAAHPTGNLSSALRNLQAPSATTFLNSTSTNGVVVTPTSLAAANAPSTTSSTGTSLTSGASASTSPATTAATGSIPSTTYSPPATSYAAPTASSGVTGTSASTGGSTGSASTAAASSGAVAATPAVSTPAQSTTAPTGG